MYPHAQAFAARLKRPLVVYDVEHTGGVKANRAITEFAAQVIHPDGKVKKFDSLVKLPEGCTIIPLVSRKTGIWPRMLTRAPAWSFVLEKFIRPHLHALWIGFNSRACDMPLLHSDSRRLGVELGELAQFDLMSLGGLSGGLAARVEQLCPNLDTSGAHRAPKDALMTLALLEALLPTVTDQQLREQRVLPKGPRPSKNPLACDNKLPADTTCFLVQPGESRHGQPWLSDEVLWVASEFKRDRAVEQIAAAAGRTPFAIACSLHRSQLITEELRNSFKAKRAE